jgi:hypothetical protein
LILVTFLAAQYAVLSGRVLQREMFAARWVMIATIAGVWIAFDTL